MTVEKPKPKQLLRPITTGADGAMNQSQLLAITCNSLKAREKSCVHGVNGFGFTFHFLKNWHKSLKPITKRNNHNHVITFSSHLKTALIVAIIITLSIRVIWSGLSALLIGETLNQNNSSQLKQSEKKLVLREENWSTLGKTFCRSLLLISWVGMVD